MASQIVLNFKNIIQELENKQLKLCLVKGKSWFVIDNQENLYQIEPYWHNSYLETFIKEGIIVKFNLVDATYINEWEKEIWEFSGGNITGLQAGKKYGSKVITSNGFKPQLTF